MPKEVAKFQLNGVDPQRGAGGMWVGFLSTDPNPDLSFCDTIINGLRDGKEYVLTVTEKKKDRSLDQNALYWKMARKLSQARGVPLVAVYRSHVRDMAECTQLLMLRTAVEDFKKAWENGHLGRFVETKWSGEEGKVVVNAYYGCSDFDSPTMNRLIANCLQDCIEMGIPVVYEDKKQYCGV